MQYGITTVPAAAVRKKPNHRAEMINQLLFGEPVIVLKVKNDKWYKIKSQLDGYKGWVTQHMVILTQSNYAALPFPPLNASLIKAIKTNNAVMHIPMGSLLWNLKANTITIENITYRFTGKTTLAHAQQSKADLIITYAMQYVNAPYLWGGKTILGIDCSGFAQTVYKMAGLKIKRDAKQQAEGGTSVQNLSMALPGDLAFFNDKEEIVHVGILLSPQKIIHAAGKVRIDDIDEKGIINTDTGKRTHTLKVIKRFIQQVSL